ncbi:MAG: hypothetical protein DLM73_09035 [Chthoniobacterales bacterium]|nr:MAG: hypothetical protein DLM73_09035 [Chthoniobacterales bacterium]
MTSTTFPVTIEQQRAAKVVGLTTLLMMVIVVFANYVLLNPLIVPGKAAETAQNILAHQGTFRLTVICFLLYSAGVVVLLSSLFVVLKPVKRGLALAGALFRLVFAMLWLLSTLHLLSALRFLGTANYLQVFEADRLQVLARLSIAAIFDDYYVGLPFFALASTVCSYLWFKSNYIPRALAGFGVIASAWCLLCAFIYLVFPGFAKPVDPYWFDSPMGIFELVLAFWLLFKGLRLSPTGNAAVVTP